MHKLRLRLLGWKGREKRMPCLCLRMFRGTGRDLAIEVDFRQEKRQRVRLLFTVLATVFLTVTATATTEGRGLGKN
jgi:hypothetical protein